MYTYICMIHKCADWRQSQYMRRAPTAPPTPSMTLDHRQASHRPPGAALGPCNAPNGVNLAPTRSHRPEVRKRRSRGGRRAAPLTAEGASRARRTPPKLPAATCPSPVAAARSAAHTEVPVSTGRATMVSESGMGREGAQVRAVPAFEDPCALVEVVVHLGAPCPH